MKRFLLAACCILLPSAVCCSEDAVSAVVAVGKPAPDFTMTGIDGKDFKLSDVTATGKNIALMFSRANW